MVLQKADFCDGVTSLLLWQQCFFPPSFSSSTVLLYFASDDTVSLGCVVP